MHTSEKILDVTYTIAYMWGYSMQHGKEIYIVKERKVTTALFYKVTSTMHIRDTAPRKRKELLAIEESMETSIQKGIFGETQSPWMGRYMGRKRKFYYFLIRGTNSKEFDIEIRHYKEGMHYIL